MYGAEYQDKSKSRSRDGSSSQSPDVKKVKPFHVGGARNDLRIPYEPPRSFSTMYSNSFANRKGSDDVGALTKEGKMTQARLKAPKGEVEFAAEGIKKKFYGETWNRMEYMAHPKLPTPNIKARQTVHTGFGQFYGETSYGTNFVDCHNDSYRE